MVVAREAHPLSHAKVPHIRDLGCGLTLQGLTFWGCELNVILLAEGGWEDGMGGGVVAEPICTICGGAPIHTDHQVTIQEHLGGASRIAQRVKTVQHDLFDPWNPCSGRTHQLPQNCPDFHAHNK